MRGSRALGLVLLLAGCAVDDLDVSGRECLDGRCPDGYSCDLAAGSPGRCVSMAPNRDAGPGGVDAGQDAGRPPRFDSGPIGVDAGPGTDAGPGNGCINPAHLFCEDFESGSTARWLQRVVGASSVDVTTERARSGAYSVRATSAATDEQGMIYVEAFRGMSVSDQWVRAYYQFRSGAGTETTILDIGNALFEQGMIVDVDSFSRASWFSSFNMNMTFDESFPVTIPSDSWFCLEVHIEQSTDAAVEVFVNGTMVSSRVGVDTAAVGTLQNVAVGSWSFAPSGARIVYVDDVIISTVRPGCL